ncbi:MAG: phosphoribosyl-AMP cyclohydrolase [Hyphomicrobium sp.]|nr:phosphoribosyl-AMP cyclohydrolase [Hyphomicrobium sp.]
MPSASDKPVRQSPFAEPGAKNELEGGLRLTPRFDANGLIAAVATDGVSGEVLMLAWMNAEALSLSIATREAHFFSRSRGRIWKKGEESGNVLEIAELRIDCDQDAVWMKVRMRGAGKACHTGARSCFYRIVPLGTTGSTSLARDESV